MVVKLHNKTNLLVLNRLLTYNTKSICTSKHSAVSRLPETIILEKNLEVPIVYVTENEKNVDLIGPPDPVSNLRPVLRKRFVNETALEEKLRCLQDQTQNWNHQFWAEHNTKFTKEKNEYVKSNLNPNHEKSTLSADEMSEFYKMFLDKNWSTHVNYNFEWYKRNFRILLLALRVNLQNITRST